MGKIGHSIISLEEVDSTNLYAERLLRKGPVEEGLVVRSGFQTAGRGQGKNRWESEAGSNLTFSVVLYPRFLTPDRQFLINKAIVLGVTDFIRQYIDEVTVKWPNDVMVGNRKIGGILIQCRIHGELLETAIAGIGLNINQTAFGNRIPHAVSLIQVLHREFVLNEALDMLCIMLEERYSQLRDNRTATLEADFCRVLMGFREERTYRTGTGLVSGIILGVDESGRLLVEHPEMTVKAYGHGEIAYVF